MTPRVLHVFERAKADRESPPNWMKPEPEMSRSSDKPRMVRMLPRRYVLPSPSSSSQVSGLCRLVFTLMTSNSAMPGGSQEATRDEQAGNEGKLSVLIIEMLSWM